MRMHNSQLTIMYATIYIYIDTHIHRHTRVHTLTQCQNIVEMLTTQNLACSTCKILQHMLTRLFLVLNKFHGLLSEFICCMFVLIVSSRCYYSARGASHIVSHCNQADVCTIRRFREWQVTSLEWVFAIKIWTASSPLLRRFAASPSLNSSLLIVCKAKFVCRGRTCAVVNWNKKYEVLFWIFLTTFCTEIYNT